MPTLVSEVNNNRQKSSNQRVNDSMETYVGHETVTTKGTRALVGATRGVLNSGMGLLGFLTGGAGGSAVSSFRDYDPKTGKYLADRAKNAGNNKTLANMAMKSNPDLSPQEIKEAPATEDAQKTPEERDREAERVLV